MNKESLDYIEITILQFKNTHTMDEIQKTDTPNIQSENRKPYKLIVNP